MVFWIVKVAYLRLGRSIGLRQLSRRVSAHRPIHSPAAVGRYTAVFACHTSTNVNKRRWPLCCTQTHYYLSTRSASKFWQWLVGMTENPFYSTSCNAWSNLAVVNPSVCLSIALCLNDAAIRYFPGPKIPWYDHGEIITDHLPWSYRVILGPGKYHTANDAEINHCSIKQELIAGLQTTHKAVSGRYVMQQRKYQLIKKQNM